MIGKTKNSEKSEFIIAFENEYDDKNSMYNDSSMLTYAGIVVGI